MRCYLSKVAVFHLFTITILWGDKGVRAEFGGYLSRGVASSLELKCENTVSGLWFVADDKGRVCPRSIFDDVSGCCATAAPKHSCESCLLTDKCCSSYEHCVSCCMAPEHGAESRALESPRGKGKLETGMWSNPFEYCRGICRTTSRSTQHENAFIDERKYCFSESGRPWVSQGKVKSRVDGQKKFQNQHLIIAASDPGHSCEEGCAAEHAVCKPEFVSHINNCDVLRDTFQCEAGCDLSSDNQHSFPGYVTRDAGKPAWPTKCFTALGDSVKNDKSQEQSRDTKDARHYSSGANMKFDCAAASDHVQRLCPCVREATLVEQSSQVDSSTDPDEVHADQE